VLVQITHPVIEPISLEEARLHLRLTDDDTEVEDSLIDIWIAAARRHAEMETGLSLITQGWRQVLDCFPGCIELERGPVQELTSLTYRDTAGANQTVTWGPVVNSMQRSTDSTLVADLSGPQARVMPAFGCTWPIAIAEIGAVAVNYTAGYGAAASDVPEGIRSWMLIRLGLLFEHRESVADGRLAALPYVDGLLDPYRVARA
jgi:uncharacterized phiE125 gp8 family phage protein